MDSAKGGCEEGRDYRFQALYPLRGKILNTNNATSSKIMDNKELNEFLKIEFGTNDLKKIRQNLVKILEDGDEAKIDISIKSKKIIILTDADSDGVDSPSVFDCRHKNSLIAGTLFIRNQHHYIN